MKTDRICRACRHATKEPGNYQHYKVGLRNCAKLPAHIFVGGNHACSKFEQKEAA